MSTAPKTKTLLFALIVPTANPERDDPEILAHVFTTIINEERERNWPENPQPVRLSAIPTPQWMWEEIPHT
jgi:hypothetical protein